MLQSMLGMRNFIIRNSSSILLGFLSFTQSRFAPAPDLLSAPVLRAVTSRSLSDLISQNPKWDRYIHTQFLLELAILTAMTSDCRSFKKSQKVSDTQCNVV
jgi:hypothetical protein